MPRVWAWRIWLSKQLLHVLFCVAPLADWLLGRWLNVILERRCEPSRLRREAVRIAGGEEVYHLPASEIDARLRERVEAVKSIALPGCGPNRGTLRMGIIAIVALERRLIRQLVVDLIVTRQPVRKPKKPIFIVGPPRSGTTLLFELLGTNFRQLTTLEAIASTGPVNCSWLAGVQYAMDAVKHIHYERWDGPTECRTALENSGAPYIFWYMLGTPFQGPTIEDYEFYARQLGVLDADATWLLKDPAHSLKELYTVFPDARVIMTHRHPSKVAPSMCSLAAHLWRLLLREDGIIASPIWKDRVVEPLATMLDNNLDYPTFDVHMDDLVKDPLETVAKIFDFLGEQPDYEAMTKYLAKSKAGKHSYSLGDFGLTEDYIQTRFQRYIHSLPKS